MTAVIGVSGRARSGKDTIANYLVERYGFVKLSFATPLKEMVTQALERKPPPGGLLSSTMLDKYSWRELVHEVKPPLTRWLLQWVGTEIFRDQVSPDYWVDRAAERLEWQREHGKAVVFSDLRFPNEAEMLKRWGGEVWRVERIDHPDPLSADHRSETSLDEFPFDRVLRAPTGVQFLYDQVDQILRGS